MVPRNQKNIIWNFEGQFCHMESQDFSASHSTITSKAYSMLEHICLLSGIRCGASQCQKLCALRLFCALSLNCAHTGSCNISWYYCFYWHDLSMCRCILHNRQFKSPWGVLYSLLTINRKRATFLVLVPIFVAIYWRKFFHGSIIVYIVS